MKLIHLFEDTPKHAVSQFLKKHYYFLSDFYKWKNFNTIQMLIPTEADYMMKILKKMPFKKVHPEYDEKTHEITFVPNRRTARDMVK